MGSLTEFKSYVRSGMAVNSHFITEIFLPFGMTDPEPYSSNLKKLNLFCDQVQLPGVSFSTNQVRVYGEFRENPYEKLYEPINMSFYVDVDMVVKNTFDKWMELIQDPDTRHFNYYDSYVSNGINILVQDKASKSKYKVELHECFPKAISPIQLDYSSRDIMKVNVSIVYKYAKTFLLGPISPEQNTSDESFLTSSLESGLEEYGYSKIPKNYFSDFEGFQETLNNYDFSFEGVRSALSSFENLGETTGVGSVVGGLGGIFG